MEVGLMTVYRQDANPNATNSELDAKVIVDHSKLTLEEQDKLIDELMKEVNSGE